MWLCIDILPLLSPLPPPLTPPTPLPALCVVGNKSDLFDQREVSRERGEEFAHQLGAMFTETSAANNIGKINTEPIQQHG